MEFYRTTRRHISEDSTVHGDRSENLECSNLYIYIYFYIGLRAVVMHYDRM
jgi:hypothetical protein